MKILHTADLHLGVKFKNVTPRPKYNDYPAIDIETFVNNRTLSNLEQAVNHAIRNKADIFIIAGDIFETVEASLEYHTKLIKRLMPLMDNGIKTILIGGNHDYIRSSKRRISLALLEDLRLEDLIFKSSIDIKNDFQKDRPMTVETDNGKISIVMLPYFWTIKREFQRYVKKYVETMIRKIKNVDYKLLTAHMDVTGARYREEDFIGSFRVIEKVPLSNLYPEKFDYVALGHIHISQRVGYPHAWYSGSLNRLNFGEYRDEKTLLLVEIINTLRVEKIPIESIKMDKFALELEYTELTWTNIQRSLENMFEESDLEDSIIKLILKVRSGGDYRSIVTKYGDKIKEMAWRYGVAGIYIRPEITGIVRRRLKETIVEGDMVSIKDALEKYIENLSYDKEFKDSLLKEAIKYLKI